MKDIVALIQRKQYIPILFYCKVCSEDLTLKTSFQNSQVK